jgi:hypothetical protein
MQRRSPPRENDVTPQVTAAAAVSRVSAFYRIDGHVVALHEGRNDERLRRLGRADESS